jgi:integrase
MLSAKKVAQLARRPGRHLDAFGLYLQVKSLSNVSWVLRYERGGRSHMFGLGPYHTVGLAEARVRARAARLQLLDGLDPIEEKRRARAELALTSARAMTFAQAASEYVTGQSEKWRSPKSRRFFEFNMETYANPVIGALPVAAIDTALVMKVIEPLWKTKTVTAARLRGQIEATLDWARVRGYRSGDNPARWKGYLDKLLPSKSARKVVHLAALPYAEVAAFVAELRTQNGIAARALEFAILTAARTGEVIGARWSEMDLLAGTWIVPAARMKSGKEHRVPLSRRALELLRGLPREADFVFIGARKDRSLSPMAMSNLLRRCGSSNRRSSSATVHGFRSSFRDWAAETTSFPNHVVEKALAHQIASAVESAYRRGDLFVKRRELMEAWAEFCANGADNSVVSFRVA